MSKILLWCLKPVKKNKTRVVLMTVQSSYHFQILNFETLFPLSRKTPIFESSNARTQVINQRCLMILKLKHPYLASLLRTRAATMEVSQLWKKSLKISLQRRKAYWRWCCPRTSSPTLAVLGTVVPECRAEVVGAATTNAAPVRY